MLYRNMTCILLIWFCLVPVGYAVRLEFIRRSFAAIAVNLRLVGFKSRDAAWSN